MHEENIPDAKKIQIIKKIGLFKHAPKKSVEYIKKHTKYFRYDVNEMIIEQGDTPKFVFFVVSGLVQLSYTSYGGKVVFIREYSPGAIFGVIGAFDGQKSNASFKASHESLVAVMPRARYRYICDRDPKIAFAALSDLAVRTRQLVRRIVDMNTLGAINRIHAELLRLGRNSVNAGNGSEIKPVPTHSEIAFRVNTQREVVTKELNRLARQGIIRKSRSTLVIASMTRLERMVETSSGDGRDLQ